MGSEVYQKPYIFRDGMCFDTGTGTSADRDVGPTSWLARAYSSATDHHANTSHHPSKLPKLYTSSLVYSIPIHHSIYLRFRSPSYQHKPIARRLLFDCTSWKLVLQARSMP